MTTAEVLSLFHHAAQQANLPGVIDIVESDAPKHVAQLRRQRFAEGTGDRFAQRLMLAAQDSLVGFPGSFGQISRFGPGKEIATE